MRQLQSETTKPISFDSESLVYELLGVKLSISQSDGELNLKAVLPPDSYFSIGFGADMVNTDMLVWQATPGNPVATDMWSSSYSAPQEDAK